MWKKLSIFIFGERQQTHLPDRVRESIAAQQIESFLHMGDPVY